MDSSLEGAIVTPDFLVYDIDTTQILPEYLELVLTNEAILNQFSNSSSGTTGRRRLSQKVFENTLIALPSIEEQRNLTAKDFRDSENSKVFRRTDAKKYRIFQQHDFLLI